MEAWKVNRSIRCEVETSRQRPNFLRLVDKYRTKSEAISNGFEVVDA